MVMLLLKDLGAKVSSVGAVIRDVYAAVQEETCGRECKVRRRSPLAAEIEFALGEGVGRITGLDVLYKGGGINERDGNIDECCCIEHNSV